MSTFKKSLICVILTLSTVLPTITPAKAENITQKDWFWPVVILSATAIGTYLVIDHNRKENAPKAGNYSKFTKPIKLMPIGDSITHGTKGGGDIRCQLWQKLKYDNFSFDFVGNESEYFGGGTGVDCDNDHEAHFGWTANQVLDIIEDSASKHKPDMAIIHLGTNDIRSGHSNSSTVSEISMIIDKLKAHNSKLVVFVAGIIPDFEKNNQSQTIDLNTQISQMSSAKSTTTNPVIYVDHYTGFLESDTSDKVHPNHTGAHKMATKWENAIYKYLK